MAEGEQMSQTPNSESLRERAAERPALNVELSGVPASNIKYQTSNVLWRLLDFVLAAVFIFAGLSKIFDLDHLLTALLHLRFGDALI